MEKIPEQNPNNDTENFHEISERRKEIRKAINELGGKRVLGEVEGLDDNAIFERHYKEPLEEVDEEASRFKIKDFGGLENAKKSLKKQKTEYESKILQEHSHIDYESILETTPEVGDVQKLVQNISELKDFRMRRMFEMFNSKISPATRKRNNEVIKTINEEIIKSEREIEQKDLLVSRQAELIRYKEDLAESGHICITPSVVTDLDAIGDRMLTGKPVFLHGPTGTGKTSLARFAATHFTGKDPEMVFCSPQTKESNVWGKTAIKAAHNGNGELTGAVFTYLEFGPLSRALKEGKTIIFDEFTALPKEQMVFIKAIFALKPGDKVNVAGDGMIEVAPGFQAVFTANLKSEKNPERQELPPEITREFEQNNIQIDYLSPDESYAVMLSRLLNNDGTLDMSFYDLNTTLPNLCRVMAEIQESYTNKTDMEVARRVGALGASNKTPFLQKFVMTQGSVEAIISSWIMERQIGAKDRSFAEFLDERFKTALTFKEYPEEDRILVAKILASRGFLLTLSTRELDLPEEVFQLNTIKSMRGERAVEELKEKSGDVKHLTLKEVAELDPFGKRAELVRKRAEEFLNEETEEDEDDPFLDGIDKKVGKVFGKDRKDQKMETITTTYTNPVSKQEIPITISLQEKLQQFTTLYQETTLDTPRDFEEQIKDIWNRHYQEIQQAIEEQGYDEILLIPGGIPLPLLSEKMKMENGYYDYIKSNSTTTTLDGIPLTSPNTTQTRIVLVHKAQNLEERLELNQTLNITGQEALLLNLLTLEDYLIFQRHYFKETTKHLDTTKWIWLSTKSGARLVNVYWDSGAGGLAVDAKCLGYRLTRFGARPSRSFF